MSNQETDRLAKLIAHTGHCSRREAETLISAGVVTVNGSPHTDLAKQVPLDAKIQIGQEVLSLIDQPRLFLYHKPVGLLCTHQDTHGRSTIFKDIAKRHPELPRLISVGRLDLNSEGLLLLTNSSKIARHLESPETKWRKRYRVRIFGTLYPRYKAQLEKGMTIEGVAYKPIQINIEPKTGANTWVTFTLTEGKNREIRRIMKAFDISVNRLVRQSFGPFQLGSLPKHGIKEVAKKVLDEQLGTE